MAVTIWVSSFFACTFRLRSSTFWPAVKTNPNQDNKDQNGRVISINVNPARGALRSCVGESFVSRRALNTAKTLPAPQLFGERAARAVGGIPQTEIFIYLE